MAGPSMIANTSAPNAMALSMAPSTSAPRARTSLRVLVMLVHPTTAMTAASGRFTRKIQCQDAQWVSAPPTSGPIAAAPDITAPHTPKAGPRYLPRNSAFTVDSVDGMMNAAPSACTARDAMSAPAVPDSAASRLPPAKTTSPTMNMVLRPQRSASLPVDSSSAASSTA